MPNGIQVTLALSSQPLRQAENVNDCCDAFFYLISFLLIAKETEFFKFWL